MVDPWLWRAVFADGNVLDEYADDTPNGHGWADVVAHASRRETRLAYVLLIPQRAHLASHVVSVGSETMARVFRRRRLTLDSASGVEVGERHDAITCVGLASAGGAEVFTFLFTDGSVVVSDDLNAV